MGLTQLLTGSVNSRYSGNFVIVLITRSRFLKTIVYSTVTWFITFLISHLDNESSDIHKVIAFAFVNVALLSMYKVIWQESLGWLSGFANYVTAGLCVVIWYIIIKYALTNTAYRLGLKRVAILFAFMFVAQMFLENVALFFLAANICCLVYAYVYKRDVNTILILTLGAIAGTFCMFSSSVYSVLMETGHSVGRAFNVLPGASLNTFISTVKKSFEINLPMMFEMNPLLCAAVLSIMSVAIFTDGHRSVGSYILVIANTLTLGLIVLHYFGVAIPAFLINEGGNTILSPCLFLLVTLESVYLFALNKDYRTELGFCICAWTSVLLVFLPLTVVRFYGVGRFHFITVVIESIFVCEMFFYLVKRNTFSLKIHRVLFLSMSILMLLLSANMANIYRVIGRTDRERIKIINESIINGAECIYLPAYQYKAAEYVFCGEPWDSRLGFFKEFYGIDPAVELVFLYE